MSWPGTVAQEFLGKDSKKEFVEQLAASGRYRIVPAGNDVRARIAAGQAAGECGGCEFDFGKQLGAQIVAWMKIQKVSNLIRNMNVYMADVKTQKMLLVKSVDVCGNTDETWARAHC